MYCVGIFNKAITHFVVKCPCPYTNEGVCIIKNRVHKNQPVPDSAYSIVLLTRIQWKSDFVKTEIPFGNLFTHFTKTVVHTHTTWHKLSKVYVKLW